MTWKPSQKNRNRNKKESPEKNKLHLVPGQVFQKRLAQNEKVTQRELAQIVQHKTQIEWSKMELKKLCNNVKRKIRNGASVERGAFKAIFGPTHIRIRNRSGRRVGIDRWILKVK